MAEESTDIPEVAALIAEADAIAKQYDRTGCACSFQPGSRFRAAQVEEFRSKVQTLRHKQEFWNMQMKKSAFLAALEESSFDVGPYALEALGILKEEESRTKKLNQPFLVRACFCCRKSSRWKIEFPLHLTEALQTVIDAFNDMPKPKGGSRRISTSLRAGPLDLPIKVRPQPRLPFEAEGYYIPLRRTSTRIRRALESQHGPQVVVLHGGAGSGKSSLARYLALQYQDGWDLPQAFGRGEDRLQVGSMRDASLVRSGEQRVQVGSMRDASLTRSGEQRVQVGSMRDASLTRSGEQRVQVGSMRDASLTRSGEQRVQVGSMRDASLTRSGEQRVQLGSMRDASLTRSGEQRVQLGSMRDPSVTTSGEQRRDDPFRFSAALGQALPPSQTSIQASISSILSETAQLHGSRFTGGVFYVPCIQHTNIVDMQLQLLQDVGFTPPIGKLSHLRADEIHSRLLDKIMEYLGKRDALVVIDDVCDPSVVRWLLLRGSKVKYLVTTQDARLCEELCDSVSIHIEKLGLDTARKILASHTPLKDPESQEVLDAIINLAVANPAALKHVSMTVLRSDDLEEWKDVRDNLEQLALLSSRGDSSMAFPREIPRNIGCSIVLALESLPHGVEKLLVALAALEGPSVPQVAVQLLVKSTEGSLSSFSRCRNVLEGRGMIRLYRQTAWWSSNLLQATGWYIDALLQRFIQVRKAKAVASMVDSLFSRSCTESSERRRGFADSDYTLTVALCAVYGSPSVADKAAMTLGASVHRNDLARIWAAPLVSLFQSGAHTSGPHTKDDKRKHEIHALARQVFLAYVHNENPDKGVRGLLLSPSTIGPTCWAIAWVIPNQKRALFAQSSRTLRGLVNLIAKDLSSDLHECATAALWNLAMATETKTVVARAPGLLEQVVRLLNDEGIDENVKRHAAGIVASLSSEKGNQEVLALFPGLVPNLVGLLTNYASCNVQVYAAHAVMHLASSGPNKEPLAVFPGALEGLVELMQAEACLHEIAVGAVTNLSTAEDNKPIIAKFPGALECLVKLMAESPSILAQKRAATTLMTLSSTRKFLAIRFFPEVLEKLVKLLTKMAHPELQEVAAKILGNLAMVEENAGVIANFPGAWQGLLRLLRDDVIIDVQAQALDTIVLLAAAPHTSTVGLSGVARAMEDLLGLVGKNYRRPNFDILEKVLLAIFRILDTGDGKNFVDISKFPGSLDQLVYLLCQYEFPEMQETAAAVLASVAKWKQNRMAIIACPGALEGLVDLLAEDRVKSSVQAAALKTLWHVAYREDGNRKIIAEFPGSLQSIVGLLEKDAKPASVQVCAALVLSTLAGVEGKYINPKEIPTVLDKLGALLSEENVSPSVQQEAAKARTLLDSETSNLLSFTSSDAYAGRGRANAQLGMLPQALSDFEVALRSMWDMDFTLQKDHLDDDSIRRVLQGNGHRTIDDYPDSETAILHGKMAHILSNQAYVKAVLKDYQGALRDANSALELQPRDNLLWQERGVLKRLMGDLPGALTDLEESLQIAPNDYETLKHCGLVCFLRGDLKAAYTIAEHALEIDLDQGYDPPDGDEYCRLGKLPVSYLDFILR